MKVLHTQRVMNLCLASWGSKSVSTGVTLRQRVQQRLGLLEVGGVKAFGEPAVDLHQELAGLSALAQVLPEPTQAHCRPQFQRLRLLVMSDIEGLMKTGFRLRVRGAESRVRS